MTVYTVTSKGDQFEPFEFVGLETLSQVREKFGSDCEVSLKRCPVDEEKIVEVGTPEDYYTVGDMMMARGELFYDEQHALRLAKHASKFIRCALAANSAVSPAVREILREDAHSGVISALLSNICLSRADYRLIKSRWQSIRTVVAGNNTVLAALARSRHYKPS